MTSTKATREATGGGGGPKRNAKAAAVHFTHDGKLVASTQNKLSSVAWFYTKPLGKDGGRLKVGELKKLLTELGVADPYAPGWSVKLPNGVTLGAVKPVATPATVEKPPKMATTKSTSSRGKHDPIKRSTASKAKKTPTKKAPTPKRSPKGATVTEIGTKMKTGKSTSAPSKLAPDKRVRKTAAKA